jgi:hypothetical protein
LIYQVLTSSFDFFEKKVVVKKHQTKVKNNTCLVF